MLLRKIIELKVLNDGYLTYDYQYLLSKVIYNKITLFDKEYARFLHDDGLRSKDEKHKKFKLFNFSLLFKDKKMNNDGIKLNKNDTIELVISGDDKVINSFLQGLIFNNEFNIYNILFKISNIRNDEKVKFNKINIYKVLSPLVESTWDKKTMYLNPYQIEYYNAIKQNLKRKYEIIFNKPYNGDLKIMIEDILKVHKKTFSIKNGYVQGYSKFEIMVQADQDMQKVAYYCGLGEKSSLGAGFIKYLTGGE